METGDDALITHIGVLSRSEFGLGGRMGLDRPGTGRGYLPNLGKRVFEREG